MSAKSSQTYFGTVDYVIFGCMLTLSSIIGLYFAYKHRKNVSNTEYLLANRSLPWFPIFVSMVASFFSAVGVMGIPAQIYSTGITFALHAFSFFPPVVLSAEILTPIYRKLELVSVNELLYLSIVLYAPSLALESVAGIPLTVTILSTGVVCTFYTALGGMRAVVWTDVFQSAVMFIGLLSTAIIGVVKVGSISKVFNTAKEWGRLDLNFSADPTEYHTFWGTLFGLMFSIMASWTISQPTVQRIIAAKSEKAAKTALYASGFGVMVLVFLLTIDALVIFAVYHECDLVRSKQITQYDQLLPYFIVNKLGDLTGIPGLFTACLFSFTLSTVSSGLNGVSALFYEDIVKQIKPNISDRLATRISQISALFAGAFITGFAFVVPKLGKFVLRLTIQIFGIVGGPYFSLFAMGIFMKRTNSIGAFVGAMSAFGFGFMLAVGQYLYPADRQLPPISIRTCGNLNGTLSANNTGIIYPTTKENSGAFAKLVSVSYTWHGLICIVLAMIIGYVVSWCTSSYSKRCILNKDLVYNYSENWFVKKLCRRKLEKTVAYQEDTVLLTRLDSKPLD